MRNFRLTIAGLMSSVAVLGCGFAAFRSNSEVVASLLHSLIVASLAFATVAAIVRGPRRRAVWVGYAVCGCAYYLAGRFPESKMDADLFPEYLAFQLMTYYDHRPIMPSDMGVWVTPSFLIVRYTFVLAFGVLGAFLGEILSEKNAGAPGRAEPSPVILATHSGPGGSGATGSQG